MTPYTMRSIAFAVVWLLAAGQALAHDHHALSRKHLHHHRRHPLAHPSHAESGVAKRDGQCEFPTDAGLVAVDPEGMNAGWAMSPDQPCKPYESLLTFLSWSRADFVAKQWNVLSICLPTVSPNTTSQSSGPDTDDVDSGQLMAQWNPAATSYTYPESMVIQHF
jgi:hypothetical protein